MRRPKSLLVLLAILMATGAMTTVARAEEVLRVPFQHVPEFLGWVPDQLIVVVDGATRGTLQAGEDSQGRPQVNVASLQALLVAFDAQRFTRQFVGARPQKPGSGRPDLTGYYKVRLGSGASLDAAIAAFEADPHVEHVERIGIHTLQATPNDTYYQNPPPTFPYDQWHYWDTHSIHADQAWDTQAGNTSVVVGILDSGVRYFHLDLGGNSAQWGPANPFAGGNVFINSAEIPNNGVDDDGNGFIDDTIGWDFVSAAGGGPVSCTDQDCSGVDNDPDDGVGHGTHVAGTVGAITNNNRSVSGVAGGFSDGTSSGTGNGVKLLPLRIGFRARYQGLDTGIVQMDWVAEAMAYVADLVDTGVNVTAINCSWGSSNSGGLGAALDALIARDVLVVHAAGNSNSSTADYLGSRTDVLNVAATDMNGDGASFTNYGSWVDVAAPGVTILSTYANPDDPDLTHHYIAVLDGTSMSTPHIVGIAALLESCNPSLTAAQKFSLIVNNTDPYTDARDLGSGIANAAQALAAASCAGSCDLMANFSAAPDSGCAPLQVSFTDLSTGTGIVDWSWDFGDGDTSTLQNPSHQYVSPGTYTVRLAISDGSCADSLEAANLVQVPGSPPSAAFGSDAQTGQAPLQVNFSDASTGTPTAWNWDFGDGNGSSEQNPTHTYLDPGTYSVGLVATNDCGEDSLVQADYVQVDQNPSSVPFDLAARGVSSWVWPNPVGPSTQIAFRLDHAVRTEIVVYDVSGRPVRHLVSRRFEAGSYSVPFDGRSDRGRRLASGLYFYRFIAGERTETRKLVVSH